MLITEYTYVIINILSTIITQIQKLQFKKKKKAFIYTNILWHRTSMDENHYIRSPSFLSQAGCTALVITNWHAV